MMPHAFTIPTALAGQSVGQAIRHRMKDLTWPAVKDLVTTRHVSINSILCIDDQRRLETGDVLEIHPTPLPAPPGDADVRIIHLDPHLVIVDKPAGMVSLRRAEEFNWPEEKKLLQPTVDEVVARLVQQAGVWKIQQPKNRSRLTRLASEPAKPSPSRPPRVFDVHRLDRDTSGLMIFALTRESQSALIALMKKHRIQREYLAVVHGHPQARKIDTWLVRDRGDGLRGSMPPREHRPDAQRAITWIEPLESFGPFTLIRCRLATGRTHQIRIHICEIGHPICGERLYTHRLHEPPQPDTSSAPRQALHSASLKLIHPFSNQRIELSSDLPPDLSSWLAQIRHAP